MNINVNELMLRKVRFGEGVNGVNEGVDSKEGNSGIAVTTSVPEATNPQAGMNALMFQGLKNVASDPQLASEVKFMKETADVESKDETAKEYVAPYKSNIAFQGKAGMLKNIAVAAMLGLSAVGTATMTTSCMEQSMEFDSSMFIDILNELRALRNDMANRDKEMAEKYDQLIDMFQQVISMMQEQNLSNQQFQQIILSNQDVIIDLLISNGMKQDEANAKLDAILNAVQNGTMTIKEALDAIKNLVSDIKGMLGEAIADFKNYFEQMLDKQQELINTNKQGFEELIRRGDITNETLKRMEEQNDSLIVLSNKQIEASNNIKEAIEKSNLDNNANFEKVIATLNINQNELIAVLMKLGYRQEQIIKMTAGEIKEAIDNNTRVTHGTNMLLGIITRQLSILPEMLNEQKITNSEIAQLNSKFDALMEEVKNGNMSAEEFYNKALGFMFDNSINQRIIIHQLVNNGKTEAEANKLLKQLINEVKSGNKTAEDAFNEISELLGDINTQLGEIKEILNQMSEDFSKFVSEYRNDKKAELGLLGGIYRNGVFQSHVLVNMDKTQQNMAVNIQGIKNNTEELLNIAKDDTKFNELISTIKNATPGSVDYDRIEQMFKLLNMNLTDVLNMNSYQLQQAIKDFQNTYIKVEEQHTEQLKNINVQLGDLKIFLSNNNNNKGIIDAINNLNNSVNKGNEDVTNELNSITNALNKLQATVDALLKTVGNQASKVDIYLQRWDTKFDAALGLLENFKSQLSTIISNQKTAEAYLNSLDKEVKNLKIEIQKLQEAAGGSNFSMEELEEMWQKHDAANFEKYSKLIRDLDLNQGGNVDLSTVEGLLASIDKKMDNIKDNSDILNKILNKLNGIDWSNPNYNAKLDEIIELLKNFKCNCDCGGNNEGVLGDLDKILG